MCPGSAGHTLIRESMYEKVGSARFFYCLFAGAGSHGAAGRESIVNEQAGSVAGQIEAIAEPLLEDLGIELVDVEFRREGHGWVLRLYIDRPDGVTLEDCSTVSREISRYLEVEDPIEHAYHLEVSSPGLERPLKKEKDFVRFSGRRARIKLLDKRDGQRVFTGVLAGMQDGLILLDTDKGRASFQPTEIARARLLFEEQ